MREMRSREVRMKEALVHLKSENTGYDGVHYRIFYGSQRNSFTFLIQGFWYVLKLCGPGLIYKLPFKVLQIHIFLLSSITNNEMLAS